MDINRSTSDHGIPPNVFLNVAMSSCISQLLLIFIPNFNLNFCMLYLWIEFSLYTNFLFFFIKKLLFLFYKYVIQISLLRFLHGFWENIGKVFLSYIHCGTYPQFYHVACFFYTIFFAWFSKERIYHIRKSWVYIQYYCVKISS